MSRFRVKERVRYAETDQMGVVYHANYFVWMEKGRTELFREYGLPYKEIESRGIMFPVVEVFCRYRRPARYDDEIIIEPKLDKYSAAKITMKYNIRRQSDLELLAEGITIHGIVNKGGKPVSIKKLPWLKKKLDEIKLSQEDQDL